MERCLVKCESQKNSGFIWVVWHKVLIVNMWCAKARSNINNCWIVCNLQTPKTLFHHFKDAFVHEWHRHGHSHFYRLIFPANVGKQWKGMDMDYCLFNKDLLKRIRQCSFNSTLVPGVILWYIWNDRNDLTINGNRWSMNLTKPRWGGLYDYDRHKTAWKRLITYLWQNKIS
jgi:hypothetical protein